jgi:hypothetical protein
MAWEGDVSFNQGGMISIQESYIESVLDDDFNVTEVKKTKETKVTGVEYEYIIEEEKDDKNIRQLLISIYSTSNLIFKGNQQELKKFLENKK